MRICRFVWLTCLLAALPVGAGVIAELEAPDLNELQVTGFELEMAAELTIDAVGYREEGPGLSFLFRMFEGNNGNDSGPRMSVYAWILDSVSREPVWIMTAEDSSTISGKLVSAEATVPLEAGRYELYLASTHGRVRDRPEDDEEREPSLWDVFRGDGSGPDDLREKISECRVALRIEGLSADRVRTFEPDGELQDAFLSVNRLGDSRLEIRGLAVSTPTTIGLYGAFEQLRGDSQAADFAWIIDENSRELIWSADRKRSKAAGGSPKNRLVDSDLSLEPGRYLVYVGSDDSHAFGSFNAAPPHDPLNWGLTLRRGPGFTEGSVELFEPELAPALIDFSQAGDDESMRQRFKIHRDSVLHLRAFGEYSSGEFYDHAWITDSADGRTVWKMTGRTTMPAGGSEKNRMFDGLVELPPGEYVLHYTSDGSHAFGSWNDATPFEPQAWGVVLRLGPSTEPGDIELSGAAGGR